MDDGYRARRAKAATLADEWTKSAHLKLILSLKHRLIYVSLPRASLMTRQSPWHTLQWRTARYWVGGGAGMGHVYLNKKIKTFLTLLVTKMWILVLANYSLTNADTFLSHRYIHKARFQNSNYQRCTEKVQLNTPHWTLTSDKILNLLNASGVLHEF